MNPFEFAAFVASSALFYLMAAMLVTRLSLALDWPYSRSEAVAHGICWPLAIPIALLAYTVRGIVGFVRWGAGMWEEED
ncbi:hypothetical protein LCGC14_2577490 [marine sediment metagenome]|uniref:Uncharacterized protein n=1 Tax=marine sediment metagenome TaxID=412755 RepID=A0A0F9B3C5_9ZZZZ